MKVAVYCGSTMGNNKQFEITAAALGKSLAQDGHTIVYGGSKDGLMGAIANAALHNGGAVVGVLPEHLKMREKAHEQLTELHIVNTMHERKAMMASMVDAFIIYPGGVGTLDEFFEVFTWGHIGIHDKKIILMNVNGFYDAIIAHISHMMEEGFVSEKYADFFIVADTLEEVMQVLSN